MSKRNGVAAVVAAIVTGGIAAWVWAGPAVEAESARPIWAEEAESGAGGRVVVGVPDLHWSRGLVVEEGEGAEGASGFAVEVAEAALKAVGLQAEFRSLRDEDPVAALERGEVDLVAPLSVTAPRLNRVDFTMPIVLCRGAVVSRPGVPAVSSVKELAGRRVVTAGGGVGELWCASAGVEYREVGALQRALEELAQGRADYLVTLEIAARWEMAWMGMTGLEVTALEESELTRAFALAARMGDAALTNRVNRGLAMVREDGTLDRLYGVWVERYQPARRPAMVPERVLRWVVGTGLGLLSLAAVVQLGLYRRVSWGARKLRESEAALRRLTGALGVTVSLFDRRAQKTVFVSEAYEGLFGRRREDVLRDPADWRRAVHEEDRERVGRVVDAGNRGGAGYDVQYRVVKPGGEIRWVHDRSRPDGDDPQRVEYLAGLVEDITERVRAEEALRLSEERARLLLDNVGVIVWEAEPGSMDLSYVSGRAEALTGYSVAEWLSPDFWASHIHEEDRERVVAMCQETTARGESHEFEYRFLARDGRVLRLRDIVTVEMRDGRAARLRGVMVDVTALRESQDALRASEKRFRSMIENSYGGVMLMDREGRVVYDNGGLDRLLGYTVGDLLGRPANDVVHPEDLAAVRAHDAEVAATQGLHRVIEFRAAHRNGLWRWIETTDTNHLDDPAIGAIVCNYRDITDRKEMEEARRRLDEEVMQTQKLESLGVLVGGVAHDFNNLLTGVTGNAALALRLLAEDDPARGCVRQIESAAARAAELTRNMLAYAGKGRISTRPVDVGGLMKDTLTLVSGSLSRTASVRVECGEGLPPAECDAAQISQVMMNLMLNASDAIGQERGTIRVGISRESPSRADQRDAFPAGWRARGPMLCLEVSDDGCGMTPETRARIFDPFFTTKFAGRGLGLAAVLGIVRGHGGAVSVRSRPGEGSTFRVWLPQTHARAGGPAPKVAMPAGPGRGTLLVVDDEPLVLDLVGHTLETAGFTVVKASGGAEALRVLEAKDGSEVDGVLLDLTMPEMDGETVLRRMRALRPGIPVTLMSGYSESDVVNRLAGMETKSFLQKPFRLEDLIATALGLVGGRNSTLATSP